MSTFNRLVLLCALLLLATLAHGDGIDNRFNDGLGGGFHQGIHHGIGHISPPPPFTCHDGIVDLTTSCVFPALGGL